MSLTYHSYLKVDKLLDLQQPESDPPEHDETLFIIIHQVYELWFKLLLHEGDKLARDLAAGHVFEAISTLKRQRMVLKTLVGQLDILETMTPMSFMSFRSRLESASGFQSAQFRELEFFFGLKRPQMLEYHVSNKPACKRLEKRLDEPSLVDHFYRFLEHRGMQLPDTLLNKDVREPTVSCPQIQDELLKIYRDQPDATILLELMTDLDEGFQEWRYRHVKMVERTIGFKTGTGGSPGVPFLRQSLFQPIFPDLWAIRDKL